MWQFSVDLRGEGSFAREIANSARSKAGFVEEVFDVLLGQDADDAWKKNAYEQRGVTGRAKASCGHRFFWKPSKVAANKDSSISPRSAIGK